MTGSLFSLVLTITCLVIIQYQKMAEKIKINLSNGQKTNSDEQVLKASRNWEKCLALGLTIPSSIATNILKSRQS
jgi:hypothetical protein